jgi:poly(ADP-ribose) glycohydrolase ARH3
MSLSRLGDRFRGALLGTFVGDALGMAVEGWPRQAIRERFGHRGREVREMMDARLGLGTYTDDTQMTLALAEALLDSPPGELDLDRVAHRFAEAFGAERGYGGNTRRVLSGIRAALAGGGDWREVVERHRLPGGSWANGAAMRVAPVALAFYPRPGAAARAAEAQAEVTGHSHPVGRSGARLQALGVLGALRRGAEGRSLDPDGFLEEVGGVLPGEYRQALEWIAGNLGASGEAAARALGVSGRASESVPAALWAFLSRLDDPEEAVVRAVGLGGDADTIGAMTGALAGAFHGASALPERWVAVLEEGERGRSYAESLADRLHRRTAAD